MGSRQYSTGVSHEQHRELMESVDARAERKAAKLAELPVFIGRVIRGRMREDIENQQLPPLVIPADMSRALGRRLREQGDVLRDQFTEQLPTLRDVHQYHRYVLGGNKNNKRYETDPIGREQARLARMRQTQHVSDNLHKNTWIQWQAARIFGAGLTHVRTAMHEGVEPDVQALRTAASAIEDFGYCLKGNPVLRKIPHSFFMPDRLTTVGQYAASHPDSLLAQEQVTLLLVQREQERREELWGGNLECYEDPEFGGYRRTAEDERDERINDALIAGWQLQ